MLFPLNELTPADASIYLAENKIVLLLRQPTNEILNDLQEFGQQIGANFERGSEGITIRSHYVPVDTLADFIARKMRLADMRVIQYVLEGNRYITTDSFSKS